MNQDFIFRHSSWFDKYYAKKLDLDGYRGSRAATMKLALGLFKQRRGRFIFETGCQRGLDDWGAGCSTQLFSEFAKRECVNFFSVDINAENIEFAKSQYDHSGNIEFACADSVEYLRDRVFHQIDLLYLDSYDYPIVEICDLYGPREDYDKNYQMLDSLGEEEFVRRHGDMIEASQEHCRKEIIEALDSLTEKSIVLIDDSGLPGGGKARLARQVLLEAGWTCLLDAYQTVWIQESL